MTAPLVSVLMTAYNREAFIAPAIESVLAQTLADFELLVVDDASTDRTVDVARRYEGDPRVRVVVNPANLGDYPNRNRAARLARGRLLKYHDSDDVMYPHCLRTMAEPLLAEPRAAFALSGAGRWAGGPCPMLLTPRMCYQREFLGTQGLFMAGPAAALFRAGAFAELGGFPEIGAGSDFAFWLRACARVDVLLVPGDLFWYRVHPGQEMQRPDAVLEYARALGCAWPALADAACPLTAEERRHARRNWAVVVARRAWRHARGGRWRAAALGLAHAGLSAGDWLRHLRPPRRDSSAGTRWEAPAGDAIAERARSPRPAGSARAPERRAGGGAREGGPRPIVR
jgi:hypothetical protein